MSLATIRISPSGVFDNSADNHKHIEVRPLTAAMGAEVVAGPVPDLSDEALQEVKNALFRHRMIFFRNQRLDHAQHAAFTQRLGPFGEDSFSKDSDHPHVLPVIKEADIRTPLVFGGGWHTDSPFLKRPPAITTLRSVETPPFGGDTAWADTALAYRALSPKMQAMLQGLHVRFSSEKAHIVRSRMGDTPIRGYASDRVRDASLKGSVHPLVRTHPVTGEKSLYVDDSYAGGIEELSDLEARPILEFLVAHITHHAFSCRLRWERDMLVMWDNRLCIHLAMNDYDGYRREMYRTTVLGEIPA